MKTNLIKPIIFLSIPVIYVIILIAMINHVETDYKLYESIEVNKFPFLEHFLVRAYPDKNVDINAYNAAIELEKKNLKTQNNNSSITNTP